LCKWTSPIILAFAYSRGYLNLNTLFVLSRLAIIFSGCLFTAYLSRGIGRYTNLDYKIFISKYSEMKKRQDKEKKVINISSFLI
jgi:hypothetical protein